MALNFRLFSSTTPVAVEFTLEKATLYKASPEIAKNIAGNLLTARTQSLETGNPFSRGLQILAENNLIVERQGKLSCPVLMLLACSAKGLAYGWTLKEIENASVRDFQPLSAEERQSIFGIDNFNCAVLSEHAP